MTVDSSSFSDITRPNFSSIAADFVFQNCLFSNTSSSLFLAYFITNILIFLPFCVFTFYMHLRQWLKQRSAPAATTSHSDSVVYHLVALELCRVFGFFFCVLGVYMVHTGLLSVGYILWGLTWYGELFFHILACVGRYMAVVHPVVYMRLKSERGLRIRDVSYGCVWLVCIGGTSLRAFVQSTYALDVVLSTLCLIIILVCSLLVLCVLNRPGPGEQGGKRGRVDQTKQRAFYIVMLALGMLMFKFVWNLIFSSLLVSPSVKVCMVMAVTIWFSIPSNVILPLLFTGCFRKSP